MQEAILLPCDTNISAFLWKGMFYSDQKNKSTKINKSPRLYGIILLNVWYV